jgi:hypothetical protein
MTIRRSGRANPQGRTLRPGRATFKPSLAEQRRQNLAAMQAMAHSGMSEAGRKNLEELAGMVKPKRTNRPRSETDEPLEHDEQKAVCSWWFHYSKTKQLDHRLLVAIPNAQALLRFADNPNAFIGYLKAEGMRVGMLDLCLFVARGIHHGLIIEMKRRTKGVVSDDQKEMIEILVPQGYRAGVCRGGDEAISVIRDYLETI